MKRLVQRCNKTPALFLFATFASLSLTGAQAGEGVLNLQMAVPYKPDITVPQAVKVECDLPKKLANYTKSAVEDGYATINMLDAPSKGAPGRTLIMQIVGIDSAPGGSHTGKKGVSIDGSLWENGKMVGNFQATRYSSGGAFYAYPGQYKGTCSILARDVKTLGKDVAEWLQKPSLGARLGEAK